MSGPVTTQENCMEFQETSCSSDLALVVVVIWGENQQRKDHFLPLGNFLTVTVLNKDILKYICIHQKNVSHNLSLL